MPIISEMPATTYSVRQKTSKTTPPKLHARLKNPAPSLLPIATSIGSNPFRDCPLRVQVSGHMPVVDQVGLAGHRLVDPGLEPGPRPPHVPAPHAAVGDHQQQPTVEQRPALQGLARRVD